MLPVKFLLITEAGARFMRSQFEFPLMRVQIVFWVMILALGVIVFQLVRLQLLEADAADLGASSASVKVASAYPKRGSIVDRNGNLLAFDRPRRQIDLTGNISKTLLVSIIQELAPIIKENPQYLIDDIQKKTRLIQDTQPHGAYSNYRITRDASQQAIDLVQKWDAPLTVITLPVRYYPEDKLGAFLLGFADYDQLGHYGIEGKYNDFLAEYGESAVEKSRQGMELPAEFAVNLPSFVGRDLVLTLDRRFQMIVEDELSGAIEKYGATGGSILVMDPKTGEILAWASSPGYSPNHYPDYAENLSERDPYVDPAISLSYEPGSVFKIITMSAGLDSRKVTLDTKFNDEGVLSVGARDIRNSDRKAHGLVTIPTILANSLNIGSAQVALTIGSDLFYNYVDRFGFGNLTSVDLAGEARGIVKNPKGSDWSESDLATNAFGQGISVTPIQMLTAVSAVANNGVMMQPHVVKAIVERGKWYEVAPKPIRTVVSSNTARLMTNVLVDAVNAGGVNQAAIPGYRIAGKTGTAEIPTKDGYDSDLTISTYVGYAPADDPRFVMLVKLDKTRLSVWAGHTSAPTFQRVARRLFSMMNIPPTESQ